MTNAPLSPSRSKKVEIEYMTIEVPKKIIVDGVKYPSTGHNLKWVKQYEETKDEAVLDNLTEYVIEFS